MQRINVIGTSCSGKTTLARAVAERLSLPYVELDALFWGRGWTPVPEATFRSLVQDAAAGQRRVIDGSYSPIRERTPPGPLTVRLRAVSTRCRRRTARASRSAVAP
jgi:hypothetical protein